MSYTRQEKEAQIGDMKEMFEASNSLYLVDMTGLSSNEINTLRADLRAKGATVRVVKNRLAKRAAAGGPVEKLDEWFRGPTAIVYHESEPITTAKALVDFAKDHPSLEIKAGLIDRQDAVDAAGVKVVSSLPGLDETRSMLLSLINGPAQKLVRLLNTPTTQMVTVIEKKGEAGSEG